MRAIVRYNRTRTTTGELTFNKTLNLYKVSNDKGNLYLTANTLNFARELQSPKRKTASRKRKK